MQKVDLYYKLGKTVIKVTQKKHRKLFTYLHANIKTIGDMYQKWYEAQDEWAFPERVIEEKAMDSLIKETGIKQRCIEIFMNGTNEEDKICVIMGIGFYNERIFKANEPSMHAIKQIELEHKHKEKQDTK